MTKRITKMSAVVAVSKLVASYSESDNAVRDFENLERAYADSMIAIEERRSVTDKLLFLNSNRKSNCFTDRVIMSKESSKAGQMELLMLRAEGATMAELEAVRGAVQAHFLALRKRGFTVTKDDNKHYHLSVA